MSTTKRPQKRYTEDDLVFAIDKINNDKIRERREWEGIQEQIEGLRAYFATVDDVTKLPEKSVMNITRISNCFEHSKNDHWKLSGTKERSPVSF